VEKRKIDEDADEMERRPEGDLPLRRRVLAMPRTSAGEWSLVLAAAYAVLLSLAFAMFVSELGCFGTTSNWARLAANGTLLAAVLALAAGVAAGIAIFRKGERSILMLLPMALAVIVAIVGIGSITGIL
jgi:hypothetical protein